MNIGKLLCIEEDGRTSSYSVLTQMKIGDYLALADQFDRLDDQREVIKSASGRSIQSRLVADIKSKAILPAIVVGVVIENLGDFNEENAIEILESNKAGFAIIDGIQRTDALRRAIASDTSVAENQIKIEYWVSRSARSLIYRMLVLNTGQQPWSMRKQIEVVYKSLIKGVEEFVPGCRCVMAGQRRNDAGVYQAKEVVEMYIAFALRKSSYEMQDQLADEFNKLDIIDKTGEESYDQLFYDAMKMVVALDKEFTRASVKLEGNRYGDGFSLFTNSIPKVCFIIAIATAVMGRPGSDRKPEEEQRRRMHHITEQFNVFIDKLKQKSPEEMSEFLQLDVLEECLPKSARRIGDVDRKFFETGFEVLVKDDFDVSSMRVVWRAFS